MTENEQIASGVLAALENSGGRPSLLRAYNCMTRLRLSFDEVAGIPDGLADAVAGLPSVLGTNVSGTELQIILGPGKAANVTAALNKLLAASTSCWPPQSLPLPRRKKHLLTTAPRLATARHSTPKSVRRMRHPSSCSSSASQASSFR